MEIVICGDGPMGRALFDELGDAGHHVRLLGRPAGANHEPSAFVGADVVHDFSTAGAVVANVDVALEAGCRRFVIGTTGWDADRPRVEARLIEHGAAAVVAPIFSIGAAVFLDIAEEVGRRLGRLGGYDPFVVDWHRAGKRDRPSGTAAELARRLEGSHASPVEVASVRAGTAPGMHLVGFDALGETVELRLTARDRRAYAAGARLAGDWLVATDRPPGIHAFASVVAELTASFSNPGSAQERIHA